MNISEREFELRVHFREARTAAEIEEHWNRALLRWPDVKLAICRDGEPNCRFPAKQRFGSKCVLASPFAYDRFHGRDLRIVAETARTGAAQIYWAHEVLFDSNVISLMERWIAGKWSDQIAAIVEFLKSVNGNKFIWNTVSYVLESSRLWEGPNQEKQQRRLYDTIRAHELLEDLDVDHFLRTGLAKFIRTGEAERRAQQQLAMWHYGLRGLDGRAPLGLCDEAYIFLLKVAEIQLAMPSPSQARKKMQLLLEYLDKVLGQIRLLIVWMAWEVFCSNQGAVFYFKNVAKRGPELEEVLRNMAWDLMLVIHQQRLLGQTIEPHHFFTIPYILTCDQGVDWLLGLDPLQAVVWFDGSENPVTIPARNVKQRLSEVCDEDTITKYFSADAAKARATRQPFGPKESKQIIQELEEKLFRP